MHVNVIIKKPQGYYRSCSTIYSEGVIYNSPNVHMTSSLVKKKVLVNHCVYSQTYWMLNLKHQNLVLWLQNPNVKP